MAPTTAHASEASPTTSGAEVGAWGDVVISTSEADLTATLELLESIPDPVFLEGETAKNQWSAENVAPVKAVRGSVLACAAAIAALMASTAIPVAKILTIKALTKGGGGIAHVVKLYWGASFNYEKIRKVGGAFGALALEPSGADGARATSDQASVSGPGRPDPSATVHSRCCAPSSGPRPTRGVM